MRASPPQPTPRLERKRGLSAGIVILLIIGLLICAGASLFLKETLKFLNQGVRSEGEVIRIVATARGHFGPVIRFTGGSGQSHEVTGLGAKTPLYQVGDRVGLYYLPGAPDRVKLDSFQELWSASAVIGGFGLLLVSIALLWFALGNAKNPGAVGRGVFVVMSLACFAGAGTIAWNRWSLKHTGIRTVGHISGTHWSETGKALEPGQKDIPRNRGEVTTAHEIIRFKTEEGRDINLYAQPFEIEAVQGWADVPVLYPANDPGAARVDTFWGLWFHPVVLAGAGFFFALPLLISHLVRSGQRRVSSSPPSP